MNIDIGTFDPATATARDLRGYFDLALAAFAVDRPDAPPPVYDSLIGRTLIPAPASGEQLIWTVREDDVIVGAAIAQLPGEPNSHIAYLELRVHPKLRRQGIGGRLFDFVKPELRARGRRMLVAEGVTADGDGAHWACSMGFRETHRITLQVLVIDKADPTAWAAAPAPGYRLEQWIGTAPQELLESYAWARRAIEGAPTGESGVRQTEWSSDEVRTDEERIRRSGIEQRVVVAVHESSGAIAGVTTVQLHPGQTEQVFQGETSVLPEHRGRELGLAIKSGMMRWLLADRPDLKRVATTVAPENTFMTNVNLRLGYDVVRVMVEFERDLDPA